MPVTIQNVGIVHIIKGKRVMKARIKKPLNQLINEEVQKQVKQARDAIYDDVAEDIVRQTIACCLLYLNKTHGFGKKRLKDTMYGIVSLMQIKPLGKDIKTVDVIEYLKGEYNLDIDELEVSTTE